MRNEQSLPSNRPISNSQKQGLYQASKIHLPLDRLIETVGHGPYIPPRPLPLQSTTTAPPAQYHPPIENSNPNTPPNSAVVRWQEFKREYSEINPSLIEHRRLTSAGYQSPKSDVEMKNNVLPTTEVQVMDEPSTKWYKKTWNQQNQENISHLNQENREKPQMTTNQNNTFLKEEIKVLRSELQRHIQTEDALKTQLSQLTDLKEENVQKLHRKRKQHIQCPVHNKQKQNVSEIMSFPEITRLTEKLEKQRTVMLSYRESAQNQVNALKSEKAHLQNAFNSLQRVHRRATVGSTNLVNKLKVALDTIVETQKDLEHQKEENKKLRIENKEQKRQIERVQRHRNQVQREMNEMKDNKIQIESELNEEIWRLQRCLEEKSERIRKRKVSKELVKRLEDLNRQARTRSESIETSDMLVSIDKQIEALEEVDEAKSNQSNIGSISSMNGVRRTLSENTAIHLGNTPDTSNNKKKSIYKQKVQKQSDEQEREKSDENKVQEVSFTDIEIQELWSKALQKGLAQSFKALQKKSDIDTLTDEKIQSDSFLSSIQELDAEIDTVYSLFV